MVLATFQERGTRGKGEGEVCRYVPGSTLLPGLRHEAAALGAGSIPSGCCSQTFSAGHRSNSRFGEFTDQKFMLASILARGQGSPILELLAGEDQALLIRRDA